MKKSIVLIAISLAIFACKNPEKSTEEGVHEVELSEHRDLDRSPCEVLTEAEIKKALEIPADAQTSTTQKSTTYPVCFYKWESISFPYEVFKGRMADRPAELSIVWATNVNPKLYKQSISVYKNPETINNLGEMATWGNKMGQVTFLKDGNLIHVKAKITADAASNKAKSIRVARIIAEKL